MRQSLMEEEERVIRLWEPLHFETPANYDYLRNGPLARLSSVLLRSVAALILRLWNRICFGLRIQGRENLKALGRRGAVSVCNHVHVLDCTMVDLALRSRRVYYVTLECNFRIPLIRRLVRVLGGVPLSPEVKRMAELFRAMEQAIRAGAVVQVYPEGVLIPYSEGLRCFRDGAFRLAVAAEAPVLPMVITFREPRGLMRIYRRKPCVTLHILPPLEAPRDMPKKTAAAWLKREAAKKMEEAMGKQA